MCRLLAYAGAPIFLDSLLVEPAASLIAQSLAAREAKTVVNADGCGIGWYGEREEPGTYRGVLPAWSDGNLHSLCRQIRSGLFAAHVRSATSGEVSAANCHPFAVGRHLFLHNGQIGGYERIRRRVDALIPDGLYAHRRGNGDSEAIFLAALARGLDRRPGRRGGGDARRDPRGHAGGGRVEAAALRRRPRRRGAAALLPLVERRARAFALLAAGAGRAAWSPPSPSTPARVGARCRPAASSRSRPGASRGGTT